MFNSSMCESIKGKIFKVVGVGCYEIFNAKFIKGVVKNI